MRLATGAALAMAMLGGIASAAEITADADWVMRNYPAESLARGEQGVVAFQVALGRDGFIQSCVVSRSSGYPRLDRATCDIIVGHARFPNGRTNRSVDGKLAWRHPAGGAVMSPPPVAVSAGALESQRLLCRRATRTGSLNTKTTYCLTRADWSRADFNARRETIRMISEGGSTI